MQHSIDRILQACDDEIAAAIKRENDRVDKQAKAMVKARENVRKIRKNAGMVFAEMADLLAEGLPIEDKQAEFLKNLHFYGRGTTLSQLTDKLDDPKPIKDPAKGFVYELRTILTNLKRDNEGTTMVSTSFLKQCGFTTDVIRWVANIK